MSRKNIFLSHVIIRSEIFFLSNAITTTFHDNFTPNPMGLVVTNFNLGSSLKSHFCLSVLANNNLLPMIYCGIVVKMLLT